MQPTDLKVQPKVAILFATKFGKKNLHRTITLRYTRVNTTDVYHFTPK